MGIENWVKRRYEKNFDSIAEGTIDIKINNYPNIEANAAWDEISKNRLKAGGYAYKLDERDIYYEFFDECVEAGREYQKRLDNDDFCATGNSLKEMIGEKSGLHALFWGGVMGITGLFICHEAGSMIGCYGGGLAGALFGIYRGGKAGKRKYKKGFFKEIKEIKEQALTDLMKTPFAEELVEKLSY